MAIVTMYRPTNTDTFSLKPHKATNTAPNHFTTTDGAYHTDWVGGGFKFAAKYPLDGNVTGATLFKGSTALASVSGLKVDISDFLAAAKKGGGADAAFAGADKFFGSKGADEFHSGAGNDSLSGKSGNDSLYGDVGNDRLWGSTGNDDLHGQGGADKLDGGRGADLLCGGTGPDKFYFNSVSDSKVGAMHDTIQDFSHTEHDRVMLKAIDANATTAGDDAFNFIGASAFTMHAGELRFAGGLLQGDVNGDGVADFEVAVQGVASLVASDFVL